MDKKDFDGDALNFTVCPDQKIAEGLERLSVNFSAFDFTGARKVSERLAIPKTVMATISNYVHSPKPVDPEKHKRMLEMFAV